jgi:putative membrane protein
MEILVSWLVAALVIMVVAYILPGISIAGFITAMLVALVLGLVNAFIKPFIILITLPINILTLGLFTLIINAAMIMLVAAIVPGFEVKNLWWALLFSIGLSITNLLVYLIFKK